MSRWQPFPIVGGAYTDPAKSWADQDTCNYLPVKAERAGSRSQDKLLQAPGLRTFAGIGNGPHRGGTDVEGKAFVVSGQTLYQVAPSGVSTSVGTIPGIGIVSMTHNQITNGNQLVIGNGSDGYVYNTATNVFAKIGDPGFPGMGSCDFMGQYILGVEPQRRFWFHSNLADATDYSTLDRYEAESAPDRIVGLIASHNDVLIFGERTIENWVNSPTATAAFQRNDGMTVERGCANANTIRRLDNTVFFLAENMTVCTLQGGSTPVPISTRAMEREIGNNDPAKALAFTWEDNGHAVYYLTFQDGKTWGYDVTQGEWARRQSLNLDRWRLNTLFKWNGEWYGGDYNSGRLFLLDWNYALEGCDLIRRSRRTGVVHNNENPMFVHGLRVLVDTGGTQSLPHGAMTIAGDLPNGSVGDLINYQYAITQAYPGQSNLVLTGALPTGLSLSASGRVSGTMTAAGSFSWTISSTDDCGQTVSVSDTSTVAAVVFPTTRKGWASLPTTGTFGVMDIANAKAIGNAATGITIATMIDTALVDLTVGLYISTGTSASAYRATTKTGFDSYIRAVGQRADGDSPVTVVSPAAYLTQWVMQIVTFDYVTGAIRMHINGALVATGAMTTGTGTSATDSLSVGMHPGASYRVRGADTSVYASVLTQTQIDKLFGYMAENWNLRSKLPVGHPYKTASVNGFNPGAAGALIWYYADNSANTLFTASRISTLYDASGHSNHAVRITDDTNDLDFNAPATAFG